MVRKPKSAKGKALINFRDPSNAHILSGDTVVSSRGYQKSFAHQRSQEQRCGSCLQSSWLPAVLAEWLREAVMISHRLLLTGPVTPRLVFLPTLHAVTHLDAKGENAGTAKVNRSADTTLIAEPQTLSL